MKKVISIGALILLASAEIRGNLGRTRNGRRNGRGNGRANNDDAPGRQKKHPNKNSDSVCPDGIVDPREDCDFGEDFGDEQAWRDSGCNMRNCKALSGWEC